ncbi:MAG TPA: hypothetical protein VJ992_12950 [Gemmatimonadales bacterium]|nr:hypothetical protein [Gemmatimonadales bacterium]
MTFRPAAVGILALGILASALRAQEIGAPPDARVVPRGALRVAFEPLYFTYNQLYDSAGNEIPFGHYLSADSMGVSLFPTLAGAQAAVWDLSGDSTFRFDAGKLITSADADIRHFPLSASFGLSRRLTFVATVPLVVTRVRSFIRVDGTGANAGLDTVYTNGSLISLIAQLSAAADQVDANIAAGSYGCPSATTCDAARTTLAKARSAVNDLMAITGAGLPQGSPVPPFVPFGSSSAGATMIAAVDQLRVDLATLGATVQDSLMLPTSPADTTAVANLLANPIYGYDAAPLNPSMPIKRTHIGDITLGLRYALADGAHVRSVLYGTARLPTGKVDSAGDFLDLATGTHALGLTGGIELALEPGTRLGLTLSGSYTREFSANLQRRIAFPFAPITPAADTAMVSRKLGDVIRFGLYPSLRLNPEFRVYGSVDYYHKGADVYSASTAAGDTITSAGGAQVADLGMLSAMTSWSIGGGIWYRATHGQRAKALPIEAGVGYHAAFSGTGGFTPKGIVLTFSLRLFYRLWGNPVSQSAPPPPQQTPAPAKQDSQTH